MKYASIGYGLVKNWQEALSEWPGKDKISGTVLNEQYLVAKDSCFACPIGCGRMVRHPVDGSPIKGLEYETTGMLGAQCCLGDMDGLILANHLCNNLGLDTISVGAILAFAMECYERGLIPEDILQGQKIPWGDREIMLKLIEDMAYKKGKLGELLASGVKHMAEVFGGNSADFAVHVRGVEIAAHDPRTSQGWGLGYAVGSTGGRHTEHAPWPEFLSIPIPKIGLNKALDPKGVEGIPEEIKVIQDYINLMNSAGCCYPIYGPTNSIDYIGDYLEAVTGHKRDVKELLRCGERAFNVKKVFNARVGIGRKDEVLPKRLTRDALKAGASQGYVARTDEMLDEYYQFRGFDPETGWPTKQKLEELSLADVGKALYG